MSRSHALQARAGSARPLAVRFTDGQLEGLARVAKKVSLTPSELIRAAVDHQVLIRSQPMVSAFWTTYGATLEQLSIIKMHYESQRPEVSRKEKASVILFPFPF